MVCPLPAPVTAMIVLRFYGRIMGRCNRCSMAALPFPHLSRFRLLVPPLRLCCGSGYAILLRVILYGQVFHSFCEQTPNLSHPKRLCGSNIQGIVETTTYARCYLSVSYLLRLKCDIENLLNITQPEILKRESNALPCRE